MGKVPPKEVRLRALGQVLGRETLEPLAPGERTEKVRVRGPAALFQELERLTPKERGQVFLLGLEIWKGGRYGQ